MMSKIDLHTTVDLTIIGGGAIGLISAYYAVEQGFCVRVLEKGELGQEASWAGAGVLSPIIPWHYHHNIVPLVEQSAALYPTLVAHLNASTPFDPELIQTGQRIRVPYAAQTKAQHWLETYTTAHGYYSDYKWTEAAPSTCTPDQDLYLDLPNIYNVRNPRLLKALKHYLNQHPNCQILPMCSLMHTHTWASSSKSTRQLNAIHTNYGPLSTRHALICAGSWSAHVALRLTQSNTYFGHIFPVHGQMLRVIPKTPYQGPMIADGSMYLLPRHDQSVLIGSTMDMQGFKKHQSPTTATEMLNKASAYIGVVTEHDITHHWSGLRPGNLSNTPWMECIDGTNNCWIHAGHYRNGLCTAPASVLESLQQIL